MDDRYDPNLILGYVEDELIAADRARVEAMLADDPALASLIADMKRDREALRGAQPVEPGVDLADGALAALERQMLFDDAPPSPYLPAPPTRRFRIAPLLTYGGIAAVLALTVTVVFQSLQSDENATGTIAMSDAPRQGMSLAEATIEAQRKAALGREYSEAETSDTDAYAATAADATVDMEDKDNALATGFANAVDMPGRAAADPSVLMDEENVEQLTLAESSVAGALTPELDSLAPVEAVPTASQPQVAAAEKSADDLPPPTTAPGATLAAVDLLRPNAPAAPVASGPVSLAYARELPPTTTETKAMAKTDLSPQSYTLNVVTATPERSLRQLNDWAFSNAIAVAPVSLQVTAPPAFAEAASAESRARYVSLGEASALSLRRSRQASLEPEAKKESRVDQDGLSRDAFYAARTPSQAQRLQLVVSSNQVAELVAALSDDNSSVSQNVTPLQPWMQWQTALQRAEVQVVIEPIFESAPPAAIPPPGRSDDAE